MNIVYDEMYDAYYIRSKIVHGDRNKEIISILESKKKLIWYVYDIQELLRQSIRKYAQLVNEDQSKTDIINGHNHRIPERLKKHRTGVQFEEN